MSRAKATQTVKRQRVVFSFESTEAQAVSVAGDFDNWNPSTHR